MKYLSALIIIALCPILSFAQETGVMLSVRGFKKNEGQLLVAFYNSKDTFLDKDHAVLSRIVEVKNDVVHLHFKDLPKGTYAVGVIHDANSNNKLDLNFIGIPIEGVGTTNNKKGFCGPPSFDDAKFNYDGALKYFSINLY